MKPKIQITVIAFCLITLITLVFLLRNQKETRKGDEEVELVSEERKIALETVPVKVKKPKIVHDENYMLSKITRVFEEEDLARRVGLLVALGMDNKLAEAFCESHPKNCSTTEYFCDLTLFWIMRDPASCFSSLMAYNKNHKFDELILKLTKTLIEKIGARISWYHFLQYLKYSFPSGDLKDSILEVLAGCEKMPSPSIKSSKNNVLLRRFLLMKCYFHPKEGLEAIKELMKLPKEDVRQIGFASLFPELLRGAPEESMEYLRTHDFFDEDYKDTLIMSIISNMLDDQYDNSFVLSLLDRDLKNMSELLKMIKSDKARQMAVAASIMIKTLRNLPEAKKAYEVLQNLPSTPVREDMLMKIARFVTPRNRDQLMSLCDQFQEFSPLEREFFKCRLLVEMRVPDYDFVGEKLKSTIKNNGFPEKEQDSKLYFRTCATLDSLARKWGEKSPEKVLDWFRSVSELPEKKRNALKDVIIKEWRMRDPKKASGYLKRNL